MRQIPKLFTYLTSVLLLIFSGVSLAQQPQCTHESAVTMNLLGSELRDIAVTCNNDQLAKLYYNRAYYKDLLKEGESLSNLIVHQTDNVNHHLTTYRIYIALVEEFAMQSISDLNKRAEILNHIYEQRSEVAELRLHGYDRTADILEKKMLLKNN